MLLLIIQEEEEAANYRVTAVASVQCSRTASMSPKPMTTIAVPGALNTDVDVSDIRNTIASATVTREL